MPEDHSLSSNKILHLVLLTERDIASCTACSNEILHLGKYQLRGLPVGPLKVRLCMVRCTLYILAERVHGRTREIEPRVFNVPLPAPGLLDNHRSFTRR